MQIDDHIKIKGVSKDDPNHEGRVVEVTEIGVYISNMNMPYAGTYSYHWVPERKIIKCG